MLEALDPVLNQRIDWLWFVISQIGFGIVAGIVVSRQERIRTWQYLPFAVRAGIEAPGAMQTKRTETVIGNEASSYSRLRSRSLRSCLCAACSSSPGVPRAELGGGAAERSRRLQCCSMGRTVQDVTA